MEGWHLLALFMKRACLPAKTTFELVKKFREGAYVVHFVVVQAIVLK